MPHLEIPVFLEENAVPPLMDTFCRESNISVVAFIMAEGVARDTETVFTVSTFSN